MLYLLHVKNLVSIMSIPIGEKELEMFCIIFVQSYKLLFLF